MGRICNNCTNYNTEGCDECRPQTKEQYAAEIMKMTLESVVLQAKATKFARPEGLEMTNAEWLKAKLAMESECVNFVEEVCDSIKEQLEVMWA